jgi:hypothetical protein
MQNYKSSTELQSPPMNQKLAHTYEVLSYDPETGNHKVRDESGFWHHCDLLVSGSFNNSHSGERDHQFAQTLVGKTISIDRLSHYVSIGHGVQVIEKGGAS